MFGVVVGMYIQPSGRWGEVEIEKDPADLFPTEPTDEATKNQKTQMITRLGLLVFTAEDGT